MLLRLTFEVLNISCRLTCPSQTLLRLILEIPIFHHAGCHAGACASEKVGEFTASGFLFKDSVEVVSVEDPDGALMATAFEAQFDSTSSAVAQARSPCCNLCSHFLRSAWCAVVYK